MAVGEHEVTAASLDSAYKDGYRARLGGRPKRTDYEDPDEAFAWFAGWAAADAKIWERWPL
jgi:ribosome modulation factor